MTPFAATIPLFCAALLAPGLAAAQTQRPSTPPSAPPATPPAIEYKTTPSPEAEAAERNTNTRSGPPIAPLSGPGGTPIREPSDRERCREILNNSARYAPEELAACRADR